MPEKTLDFNNPEQQSGAGNGQPATNTPGTEPNPEEIDKAIDATVSSGEFKDDDVKIDDEDGEDTVVLPKDTVKKLLRDRKNYKDGLLSVKDKLKAFKKPAPAAPAASAQAAGNGGQASDKATLIIKGMQQDAIAEACKDPIVNEHWDEIMANYHDDGGVPSTAGYLKKIRKAAAVFFYEHPEVKAAPQTEDSSAAADLSQDHQKPSGGQGGNQKPTVKSLFPKRQPVTEWYGKPKG